MEVGQRTQHPAYDVHRRPPLGQTVTVTTILDVLRLVLRGFWMAVGHAVAGVVCHLLVVTIPSGRGIVPTLSVRHPALRGA